MNKKMIIALCATVVALPLAGCNENGYGGGVAVGYGSPYAYNGYYDDYYGPIYDGYWGDGDAFFYRSHSHGRYVRDAGGHFRHDAMNGYQPMHVNGPAFRGHGPARNRH